MVRFHLLRVIFLCTFLCFQIKKVFEARIELATSSVLDWRDNQLHHPNICIFWISDVLFEDLFHWAKALLYDRKYAPENRRDFRAGYTITQNIRWPATEDLKSTSQPTELRRLVAPKQKKKKWRSRVSIPVPHAC